MSSRESHPDGEGQETCDDIYYPKAIASIKLIEGIRTMGRAWEVLISKSGSGTH